MRYGILSDVHGNLHALRAAVEVLVRAGVDGYLSAGDLVGYGPFPNECVESIADLGALCVAGNHDLVALGHEPLGRCSAPAQRSLEWTRRVLRDDARAYLSRLPMRLAVAGGVVLAHGSLADPWEYVNEPEQAAAQLERLAGEHPDATVLVLGHRHRPLMYDRAAGALWAPGRDQRGLTPVVNLANGGGWLLNAGSVGQSRERLARARCLLLDLKRREATFYAIPYDVEGCHQELRRQGLPPDSCHQPAGRWHAGAGGVRRLGQRVWGLATVASGSAGGAGRGAIGFDGERRK